MLPAGFLDSARALVGANTVSSEGTLPALAILRPLYQSAGLRVRTLGESETQQAIVAGSDARPGGVLMVTHLDTVPPGAKERWTETSGDPWKLTEKDGWLFGLGVADVKLDALCKIEAARRLRGKPLARPFWLCGTFGEEVGLRGARHLIASDLFREIAPRQVLCGEPSELQIIHAHKGYAVVRCTITDAKARLVTLQDLGAEEVTFAGQAAHSSTPHLGVNAIAKALAWSRSNGTPVLAAKGGSAANVVPARATLLVAAPREYGRPAPDEAKLIPQGAEARPNLWRALATAGALGELWLQILRELEPREDPRFDPKGAVGGLNVLESGPAWIAVQLDARLLPQHDADALLVRFEREARAWIDKLGRGELKLEISIERNAAGMALPEDSPLVKVAGGVLQRHGLDGKPRAKPTSTEAGLFFRAGCEAIVFGPGVSTGNAHTANERIEIAQLERAIDIYEALLVELCGRP
jgi:acetylornithine deacetylase/succinyl-diaminopimelate desuccinylase-like protein